MGRLTRCLLALLMAFADAPAMAAPARVASLGLCTDELVLLLAAPEQLVSVSFLAHDPLETALSGRAATLHSNNGTLGSVIALRPDLVVTGGTVNRFASEFARRTGMRVLDVPPPADIAGLRANIRRVAIALDRKVQGEALVGWFDRQIGAQPANRREAAMIVAGGLTPQPDSLAAEMLGRAGLVSPFGDNPRITLESLAARPKAMLVIGDYRSGQYSLPQAWLQRAVSRKRTETMRVDGRNWTCPGPLAAADVKRLRESIGK